MSDNLPEPLLSGSFAIFKTPQGGLVVAYRPKGDQDDKHLEIPATIISMASSMGGGSLEQMAAMLAGGLK